MNDEGKINHMDEVMRARKMLTDYQAQMNELCNCSRTDGAHADDCAAVLVIES